MLRPASEHDIDFLYSLYMHPAINRWLLYEDMSLEAFRPIATDLIGRAALYVYEQDGVPVGMCKIVPQKYRNSHILYLGGVAVAPEFSGKGIGHMMLKQIIELCRQMGFSRIELTVAVENARAIRLYEDLGFVKEGILKNYSYIKKEELYLDEQVMALVW